jgi:hypothetical protein
MAQRTKNGERWQSQAMGTDLVMTVTRMSKTRAWVDITCTQMTGEGRYATWTKRMPEGIPDTWVRVS